MLDVRKYDVELDTSFLEKQGLWIFSYVFIHPNPLMFFTRGQCKCKLFVRVILTQFFFPFLVNHLSKLMPRRVTKCPSLQNFFLLGKKNRKEKLKKVEDTLKNWERVSCNLSNFGFQQNIFSSLNNSICARQLSLICTPIKTRHRY